MSEFYDKSYHPLFSARFDRYEHTNQNTKVHIRNVRIEGVLIAENYVFDEEITSNSSIPNYYKKDDFIAFWADIKLVNVKF
jgi:hypothetical protein